MERMIVKASNFQSGDMQRTKTAEVKLSALMPDVTVEKDNLDHFIKKSELLHKDPQKWLSEAINELLGSA